MEDKEWIKVLTDRCKELEKQIMDIGKLHNEERKILQADLNSPVFFARWILKNAVIHTTNEGYVCWKYEAGEFEPALPFEANPDGIYDTHELYQIFKAWYQPNEQQSSTVVAAGEN